MATLCTSHSEADLQTHRELGYRLSVEMTDMRGREGGERGHLLTSCQTVRCFSTSSGRVPKLSGNISDKRMISSHPWSDNQAQGFLRLLFSREMFPNHNRIREVNSRHQHTGKSKQLHSWASLTLGKIHFSKGGWKEKRVRLPLSPSVTPARKLGVASSLGAALRQRLAALS